MNCKQARAAAIEKSRAGLPVTDLHFADCPECARFLQVQLDLQSHLKTLARDVPQAPEFQFVSKQQPRPFARWLAAFALATSLAVIAFVVRHHPPPIAPSEPFVQIPYTAPLAPYERTSIVRMDVPVAALISAGFEVHAPDTGQTLKADVLFGQDGRARAVRLLIN